jgi:nondiscriminating aspartyl-tRNA synthetase
MSAEAPTRDSKSITPADFENVIEIDGWVQEIRALGGIAFLIVRDRHGTIQVALPKKKVTPELFAAATAISRESVVRIQGTVKQSAQARNGYEIIPSAIDVLDHPCRWEWSTR